MELTSRPSSATPMADLRMAHLEAIVESSEDAIITKSLEGSITSWNPAAERIFGYTAEEAIGSPISIIIPPDRGAEEPDILARIRRGERIEHLETTRMHRDGRRVDVCLTISPVRDATGHVVGAAKIAREITETKLTLQKLQLEAERLQVTLKSIGDGVIVADVRGYVVFLNPVAEALTGWKQASASGKPLDAVFNIVNEVTRRRVENPAVRAISEGVVVGLANHTILISQQGTEIAIDDSASPIRGNNGDVLGIVLVFRDVTGQRAVDNMRAKLSALVESSDDAIIGKDLDGKITSWNKGAEQIYGYTQQEVLGRPITMLIPPERLGEEAEILQKLRRGERVVHFETVRLAKDRRKVEVSVTISPIHNAHGEVVGASKIARDITERKRAERELEQAHQRLQRHAEELEEQVGERTAELRQSLEELEIFSSSVSHDLKAPLRSIAFHSQTLQEDYGDRLPPEAHAMIDRVLNSCGRLSRFIDNVLSFARLRTGNLEMAPVDLDGLLLRVIEEYPHAKHSEAVLDIERPLLAVVAHESLLVQVVANLISNGVKFVAPGTRPKLHIWTESRGARVRLWVEDNGIGIAKEDQGKVFGLFTRLRGTSAYEGSGVGLAVVQKAVLRMGGQTGVESEPGQGSRFWIELEGARRPEQPAPQILPEIQSLPNLNIRQA